MERTFRHIAEAKNVGFSVHVDPGVPASVLTDAKRLQQIIKNLLANAFKFTHRGQVTLNITTATSGWGMDSEELTRASSVVAFSVRDTGIGIPTDKQQIIFEAFQQADGSTSRKYGGTGLGLAISRELSHLLGGEIRLTSTPGQGSTFTLYLPDVYPPRSGRKGALLSAVDGMAAKSEPAVRDAGEDSPALSRTQDEPTGPYTTPALAPPAGPLPTVFVDEVGDDRNNLNPGDKVLLIVENDLGFARFLLDSARQKGFKGLVTSLGASALGLTREYKPHAMTLDICLPDVQGWRVLDRIKNDILTRHIPICVISTEESKDRAMRAGVYDFLAKPIENEESLDRLLDRLHNFLERQSRTVLVFDENAEHRNQIQELLASEGIEVQAASTLDAVLEILRKGCVDCMVAGPRELESSVSRLLEEIEKESIRHLPVVVYGNSDHPSQRDPDRRSVSENLTFRYVHSRERLLDQATLFLHIEIAKLEEAKRKTIADLHQSDQLLANRKVLIVDDDMRNIFALSALLEEHQMTVLAADNGRDAIGLLESQGGVEVVLMDIMMPEMDGIETIQEIRKIPAIRNVPIIAVTAKAMKGDRERCIEAGAWDYLAKPVDPEELFALLRAWLHR